MGYGEVEAVIMSGHVCLSLWIVVATSQGGQFAILQQDVYIVVIDA